MGDHLARLVRALQPEKSLGCEIRRNHRAPTAFTGILEWLLHAPALFSHNRAGKGIV